MSQVVLVTGCSSGFGLLVAVEAARRGHRVVATMRDLSRRAALDEAAEKAGVSLDVEQLDVTDQASIDRCVEAVESRHARVDALVNNAGFGMGGALYDLSMDELRAQFETNFFGAVAMTKAVLPGMVARRSGRIVQVSSGNSLHPVPGLSAYSSSKRALDGLTEALRVEVAPFGIHVTSVLPGTFRTEAFEKRKIAAKADDPNSPYFEISRRVIEKIDRLVALRADDPKKVAVRLAKLLEESNPPLKLLVGRDVTLQTFVRSVVPQSAWELLLGKATGFR